MSSRTRDHGTRVSIGVSVGSPLDEGNRTQGFSILVMDMVNVSICHQIIKRLGEGITVKDDARHISKGTVSIPARHSNPSLTHIYKLWCGRTWVIGDRGWSRRSWLISTCHNNLACRSNLTQ